MATKRKRHPLDRRKSARSFVCTRCLIWFRDQPKGVWHYAGRTIYDSFKCTGTAVEVKRG